MPAIVMRAINVPVSQPDLAIPGAGSSWLRAQIARLNAQIAYLEAYESDCETEDESDCDEDPATSCGANEPNCSEDPE